MHRVDHDIMSDRFFAPANRSTVWEKNKVKVNQKKVKINQQEKLFTKYLKLIIMIARKCAKNKQ
jgi:hypothetical protein